jgi:hypothetical protein
MEILGIEKAIEPTDDFEAPEGRDYDFRYSIDDVCNDQANCKP